MNSPKVWRLSATRLIEALDTQQPQLADPAKPR
jgi:hypothetical protein